MRLAVITPIGPGHADIVRRAIESVDRARATSHFSSVSHVTIDDYAGSMGRSRARNIGMRADADWFFLLDADDIMRPDALMLNDFSSPATFGAVSLNGAVFDNIYPCSWRDIALHGARGTLSMGCFVRADVTARFNESLDTGEDFDFYMRLPGFRKIARPLVDIGCDTPSAGGPRRSRKDWTEVCNDIIARYIAADPERYDLGGDAILAAAGGVKPKSGNVPQPVPV